ncbi:MAG: hypothetical protein PHY92_00200 [Alphaproteobacteria bacterium]|nr:hypothetical protein [Alphaproteobacteria bacterium]
MKEDRTDDLNESLDIVAGVLEQQGFARNSSDFAGLEYVFSLNVHALTGREPKTAMRAAFFKAPSDARPEGFLVCVLSMGEAPHIDSTYIVGYPVNMCPGLCFLEVDVPFISLREFVRQRDVIAAQTVESLFKGLPRGFDIYKRTFRECQTLRLN